MPLASITFNFLNGWVGPTPPPQVTVKRTGRIRTVGPRGSVRAVGRTGRIT